MRINSSGNVGIGTTNPSADLRRDMFGLRATCGPWFGICSGFGLRVSGFGAWQQQHFVRVRGAILPGSSGKPEHLFANLQLAPGSSSSAASSVLVTKKIRTIVIFMLYYEIVFLYTVYVRTILEREKSHVTYE